MSWTKLHAASERFAIEAQQAFAARDPEKARRLYRKAAAAEQNALDHLEPSKARSRGITAVSAVALWYKANEFDRAEQLACSMLEVNASVPDFAKQDLRNLLQAIWTESVKANANVSFIPGQVTVSVKGGDVVMGGAPLDLIVDKIQTVQSMYYRIIEFINGNTHRRQGRPAKEIQDSFRPWLFQSAPSSYQFSVTIQKPAQMDFFKKKIEPGILAQRFLEIVNAAGNDDASQLEKLVPDETYRNTFLKLARNLAPTGKTFEQIEFRAAGESRPVALGVDSRRSINQQLRKDTARKISTDEKPEELTGILRAVHLDEDWLEIIADGSSVRICGLKDAVDDVIGPMVNRSVVVRVVRRKRKNPIFIDIEMVE